MNKQTESGTASGGPWNFNKKLTSYHQYIDHQYIYFS